MPNKETPRLHPPTLQIWCRNEDAGFVGWRRLLEASISPWELTSGVEMMPRRFVLRGVTGWVFGPSATGWEVPRRGLTPDSEVKRSTGVKAGDASCQETLAREEKERKAEKGRRANRLQISDRCEDNVHELAI